MNIDDMIAKALKEEFEERVEQCSADAKKHRFSLSYRLWEHKALRDLSRDRVNTHWSLKKAHTAVASCIAAFFILAGLTVYAAVNMGRYSLDTKPDYSKLFIESISSDKTSIEEYYGLPEEDGWEIIEYSEMNDLTMIKYKCGNKIVIFSQNVIDENLGNINTENAVIEPMSIFEENDGFFITFQKEGGCGLYWIYDGYFFKLIGNINQNEAVNLAQSIKTVEFQKNFKKL